MAVESILKASNSVLTGMIGGEILRPTEVTFAACDGLAVFEGDIVLGSVDFFERQAAMATEGRRPAAVIAGARYRWPNGVVPYDIRPDLEGQDRVMEAIAHWQEKTAIRFVARTSDNAASHTDWVTFRPDDGCAADIGRKGGQQFVYLGSGCNVGSTIHEIGHLVGLWHEQSRDDRDKYVDIIEENIEPGKEHNFAQHVSDGDDVGPYDFGSIMHYPPHAFAAGDQLTIVAHHAGVTFGQREELSEGDIAAVRSLYGGAPTWPDR